MRPSGDLGVQEIVRMLGMHSHPEGGWYVETHRAEGDRATARSPVTAIYFLIAADQLSAWHQVDATEIWFWQAGSPLTLSVSEDGVSAASQRLGPDLRRGDRLQGVVPPGAWQTAESLGAWTLVSCVVAPGFEFDGFKLAPPDWRPGAEGPPTI